MDERVRRVERAHHDGVAAATRGRHFSHALDRPLRPRIAGVEITAPVAVHVQLGRRGNVRSLAAVGRSDEVHVAPLLAPAANWEKLAKRGQHRRRGVQRRHVDDVVPATGIPEDVARQSRHGLRDRHRQPALAGSRRRQDAPQDPGDLRSLVGPKRPDVRRTVLLGDSPGDSPGDSLGERRLDGLNEPNGNRHLEFAELDAPRIGARDVFITDDVLQVPHPNAEVPPVCSLVEFPAPVEAIDDGAPPREVDARGTVRVALPGKLEEVDWNA